MFLGYLLFGFGLNYIDASKATLITLIEPLVATVLAVFIIGEKFKVIGWIGVALVSLCLLIQTIKPQNQLRLAIKKYSYTALNILLNLQMPNVRNWLAAVAKTLTANVRSLLFCGIRLNTFWGRNELYRNSFF